MNAPIPFEQRTPQSWRRPPNPDGSCFRCNGVGWVELCGGKANGPDDGTLWSIVRACWWCMYLTEETLPVWFDHLPVGIPEPRTTQAEKDCMLDFQRMYRAIRLESLRIGPSQMTLFEVCA